MYKSGVCDIKCQLFAKEIAKREHALRVKWFITNRQKIIDNLKNDKYKRKARKIVRDEEDLIKQKNQENELLIEKYRRKVKLYPEWRPEIDNDIPIENMKTVKPEIKAILYTKNARSFDAKNSYLKERYKEPPENRFYYPDCSNWLYGWRLKDFTNE